VAPFSMWGGNTREQAVRLVKESRLDHAYDLVLSWSHKMLVQGHLAGSVEEHATLDLGVMSSSPTSGVEIHL